MLKFEIGKFYMHATGKMIAVLGEVYSFTWGDMLVVEEAIPVENGVEHYMSCILNDCKDHSAGWTEVGKPEWMTNFEKGGNA